MKTKLKGLLLPIFTFGTITFTFVILVSCFKSTQTCNNESSDVIRTNEYTYKIVTIDNHEYIQNTWNGNLTHSESCKCKY